MDALPATFRDALSALPSGVTIITSADGEGVPAGATVSAFMSLSLDPPLVLMSLKTNSWTARAVRESRAFVAHIVGETHRDLAMRFASSQPDKFAGLPHRTNNQGIPVLSSLDVNIECSLYAQYPGGDHDIFVGLVDDIALGKISAPTVWYDRAFHGLRSQI